jgi:hypothetical protein
MKRFLGAALVTAVIACLGGPARADEKEAKAVIDKAIKAVGGEEVLGKAGVVTWKTKGTLTFNGDQGQIKGQSTAQGLDRYRGEFEGNFGGNMFKGVTVLNGDKGWRKFGDDTTELDADALANEKRTIYLQLGPVLLVPLKGKGFKVESAPDEKVGDKPAAVVKVTGPDGKDFTLYFDKESGLPVRMVAKVVGFANDEYTQDTSFTDYKDFGGIKKATKSQSKRDGEKFIEIEVTDFKVLDKAEPDAFTEPK